MIKKIVSILMIFVYLLSPIKVNASKVINKAPQPIIKKSYKSTLYLRRIAAQKAFLVGLLCTTGTNVYIKFHPDIKYKALNFTVVKIDETNLKVTSAKDNSIQIQALLHFLNTKKNIMDFKYDSHSFGILLSCIKVNKFYLTQKTIHNMGDKILKLIYEKKENYSQIKNMVNLSEDTVFIQEVVNIFKNPLLNIPRNYENTLNFYTLPSDQNKIEPVQNVNHVNYIKTHPEESSLIEYCYYKAFLLGILNLAGTNMSVRNFNIDSDCSEFIDAFNLYKINDKFSRKTETKFLVYLLKRVSNIIPPEKLEIEILEMNYSMPGKVTICKNITLNEIDIFNLGQRFYNCVYNMMTEHIKTHPRAQTTDLSQIPNLNENLKEEFKKYTGKDLPNLK